ncbi:MAG: hypothetical protein ACRCS8_02855 [Brevinema sp.]
MKNLYIIFIFLFLVSCASNNIVITKQGNFSAGGSVITNAGEYRSQDFNNWQPYPAGQTYHGDHASVFYQIPKNARK